MIVFIDNINMINYINNPVIFNLSSFYSGYDNITSLMTSVSKTKLSPVNLTEYVETPQFDNAFMSMIFTNTLLFGDFMKIIMNAYEGYNVIILVERDAYRDMIMESLIKIIQLRYGYNCWIVEDFQDLECLSEPSFTPMGIINLDNDKKLLDKLYSDGQIVLTNNYNKE